MMINASEASGLVDRHERIVRGWILSGLLKAKKAPNGRWIIKTEDLMKVRHVDSAHRARIANWVREQEQLQNGTTAATVVNLDMNGFGSSTASSSEILRLQLQIEGLASQMQRENAELKQRFAHDLSQIRETIQEVRSEQDQQVSKLDTVVAQVDQLTHVLNDDNLT